MSLKLTLDYQYLSQNLDYDNVPSNYKRKININLPITKMYSVKSKKKTKQIKDPWVFNFIFRFIRFFFFNSKIRILTIFDNLKGHVHNPEFIH
jgi:hypothetical protein